MTDLPSGDIELYESSDGSFAIEVRTDGATVWLTQQQLAALFGRDPTTIGRHVRNALREELADLATTALFAVVHREGARVVERQVEHYNLDMVLSVGYRVKSPEGIHFRRWASSVLKKYLIKGVALNEQRLNQIGSIVQVLSRSPDELVSGVADVLASYVPGLRLLREYDNGHITVSEGAVPGWELTIDEARTVVNRVAAEFPQDKLFGRDPADRCRATPSLPSTRASMDMTYTRLSSRRPRTCSTWSRKITLSRTVTSAVQRPSLSPSWPETGFLSTPMAKPISQTTHWPPSRSWWP